MWTDIFSSILSGTSRQEFLFSALVFWANFWTISDALLFKRDPRSTFGWILLCFSFPLIAPVIYLFFGRNRIFRRAQKWRKKGHWQRNNPDKSHQPLIPDIPDLDESAIEMIRLSGKLTGKPLLEGCRVEPLTNGEETYPEMLNAIRHAKKAIYLCTYIFDADETGHEFMDALAEAQGRGVIVRVLIDWFGTFFSYRRAYHYFKKRKIKVAVFLPPSFTKNGLHVNLRNHRKILIIDGKIGFTGGMNIGNRHLLSQHQKIFEADIHYKILGPVVAQMENTFLDDWFFTTGEELPAYSSENPQIPGKAYCRGITAGPNEDFEKLRWIVNAAFALAKKRIRILTPYFVPDVSMLASMYTACLRGIDVELILPGKNQYRMMTFASTAYLSQVIDSGVKVYLSPPPFIHTKLLLMDDYFALVGSANLDPRSLRLNFEFNLEIYDKPTVKNLDDYCNTIIQKSQLATLKELRKIPLFQKYGNAIAKLFSPYL